jgi:hypothetical protein
MRGDPEPRAYLSVGGGPIRAILPAPTWGLWVGLLLGAILVFICWLVGANAEFNNTPPPAPTTTTTTTTLPV